MPASGGELIVFGLLALLFGSVAVRSARRLVTVRRTLRHGLRTTGTCVRMTSRPYNRPGGSEATRHYFAFRTADGTTVEFMDLARQSMGPGDPVDVTYDPRDPRHTATIAGRGSSSPVLQNLALTAGCGLGTAGFTTLFIVQLLGGS